MELLCEDRQPGKLELARRFPADQDLLRRGQAAPEGSGERAAGQRPFPRSVSRLRPRCTPTAIIGGTRSSTGTTARMSWHRGGGTGPRTACFGHCGQSSRSGPYHAPGGAWSSRSNDPHADRHPPPRAPPGQPGERTRSCSSPAGNGLAPSGRPAPLLDRRPALEARGRIQGREHPGRVRLLHESRVLDHPVGSRPTGLPAGEQRKAIDE